MPNEILAVIIGAIVIILGVVAWRFYITRKRHNIEVTWEETVVPEHIHTWVDELTTIRNPLVSIGYEKPYEELVEQLRFADGRTDEAMDKKVSEKIEDLIKVAVVKDRKGIEKALQELKDTLEQRRDLMSTREGEV